MNLQRNNKSNNEIPMFLIYLMSFIGVLIVYIIRFDVFTNLNRSRPILLVFDKNISDIFIAIVTTISVTAPIALELLLDIHFQWKSGIDDHRERIQMILTVIVPGFFVIFSDQSHRPFVFCCSHAVQYVGCLGAVLSLCNKLVPQYFTERRVLFVHFFFSMSSVLSMMSIGHNFLYIPNLLVFVTISISLGSFLWYCLQWMKSLGFGFSFKTIRKIEKLSINETSCLLYIVCTFITIIIIPGIAAATVFFDWEYFNLPIVLIFIYSLAGFSLFPSCIPGRVARYFHSEHISKRAALRYLSHEIRSPLNVVHNGISFAIQDLRDSEGNNEMMQNLEDIREASQAAVSILDEFLNFEKIESGLFQINPVDTSLDYIISSMVKPLRLFARHKNIQFHINIQLDNSKLVTNGLCIDRNKMCQVLRNLVINAVKFTHDKGKITITFREEIPTTTTSSQCQSNNTSIGNIVTREENKPTILSYLRRNFNHMLHYFVINKIQDIPDHHHQNNNNVHLPHPESIIMNNSILVIEVTDTGVGIPEHVHHQIFREFFQFDPDKLQGGGGSGLGLWICKEIIQLHKGSITFTLGPNNIGTTFIIRMPLHFIDNIPEDIIPCLQLPYSNNSEPPSLKASYRSSHYFNHSSYYDLESSYVQPFISKSATGLSTPSPPLSADVKEIDVNYNEIQNHLLDHSISSNSNNSRNEDDEDENDSDRNDIIAVRSIFRILIVDDSELNRRMMKRSVQRVTGSTRCSNSPIDGNSNSNIRNNMKIQFDEADDGLSAIDLVRTSLVIITTTTTSQSNEIIQTHKGYDIIFMDNIMLKMNGPEAAKIIRDMGYQSRIIGVTGNTLPKDMEEFIHFGANMILTKPVDITLLQNVISDTLKEIKHAFL